MKIAVPKKHTAAKQPEYDFYGNEIVPLETLGQLLQINVNHLDKAIERYADKMYGLAMAHAQAVTEHSRAEILLKGVEDMEMVEIKTHRSFVDVDDSKDKVRKRTVAEIQALARSTSEYSEAQENVLFWLHRKTALTNFIEAYKRKDRMILDLAKYSLDREGGSRR